MIIWDTLKVQNNSGLVSATVASGTVWSFLNPITVPTLTANNAIINNLIVDGTLDPGDHFRLPYDKIDGTPILDPFEANIGTFNILVTNLIHPTQPTASIVLDGNVRVNGTLTKSDDGDIDMVGKPFLYVDIYEYQNKDGLIISFIGPDKDNEGTSINYELQVAVNNGGVKSETISPNRIYGYFPDTHLRGIDNYEVTIIINNTDSVTTGFQTRDGARSTDGFKGQIFSLNNTEFNVPSNNITKVNNIIIQRCSITSGLIASFDDNQTEIKPCSSPNVEAGLIGRLQAEAIIQSSSDQQLSINAYAYAYAEYKKDNRLSGTLRDTSMVVAPQYWIESTDN